ncbi:AAA family ATPase [Paraburkholderia sp. FT54]|uniref:AAA family ATPase n=1 Tax=Paraburkholderia sp. FT54 TaxID=3074437 RepID=UPI002877EC4A|nr:AAA family ATPase [Paraburkholderia sp. FT54]WNC95038.1 AAA family ATPase [Paraburkholderia sp. FT54]
MSLELPEFEDIVILYGENGSGKTTLLRLVFHMLSAANNRGHRTYIRKTPFQRLALYLSDGTILSAKREHGFSHAPIEYVIELPDGEPVRYRDVPDDLKERLAVDVIRHERSTLNSRYQFKRTLSDDFDLEYKKWFRDSDESTEKKFLSTLAQVCPHTYYISTERQIQSDQLDNNDEAVPARQRIENRGELIASTRSVYLKQALAAGAKAIHAEVFKAANLGGADSNEVYKNLVSMLSKANLGADETSGDLMIVLEQLRELRVRNRSFARLGLMPNFNMEAIFPILRSHDTKNKEMIELVVKPYIDSMNKRLDALESVHTMIRTFLRSLNDFFAFKKITFRMGAGFQITGMTGEALAPDQLSSGEQQLLLIFCNVLASRSGASLFIIDEPEISLNVKWQRNLIDSLRKIIAGSSGQLLIATHSIELLAQHSESVASLKPTKISKEAYLPNDSEEND